MPIPAFAHSLELFPLIGTIYLFASKLNSYALDFYSISNQACSNDPYLLPTLASTKADRLLFEVSKATKWPEPIWLLTTLINGYLCLHCEEFLIA